MILYVKMLFLLSESHHTNNQRSNIRKITIGLQVGMDHMKSAQLLHVDKQKIMRNL